MWKHAKRCLFLALDVGVAYAGWHLAAFLDKDLSGTKGSLHDLFSCVIAVAIVIPLCGLWLIGKMAYRFFAVARNVHLREALSTTLLPAGDYLSAVLIPEFVQGLLPCFVAMSYSYLSGDEFLSSADARPFVIMNRSILVLSILGSIIASLTGFKAVLALKRGILEYLGVGVSAWVAMQCLCFIVYLGEASLFFCGMAMVRSVGPVTWALLAGGIPILLFLLALHTVWIAVCRRYYEME